MKRINVAQLKQHLLAKARVLLAAAMEKRHQWILNIVIIVLLNLVGLSLYFRIDLTGNNAYSLSRVSRDLVSSLEEPLIVKVFFSKDLPPPYNSVYRYLADLLEEYAQSGNGNFRYEFVDVEKNRDMAADFGVQPVQVRELKKDRVSTRSAYMGLAVVHGDLIESVEFVAGPEQSETTGIEYRITTLIQKMVGKVDALLRLDKPVTVTLYASGNLPITGMQGLNERVASIVKKAGTRNYNKLAYRFVDPDVDRSALDLADLYGIPRLRWPAFTTMEGRFVNPGEGMIGMVLELGDRFETIQLLSRSILGQFAVASLDDLENRLSASVDNLISVNPGIGYATGHGERDMQNQRDGASVFKELISDMYDLKPVDLAKEEIPADIQTIIVNGPRTSFSDAELLKIDQFLMNGKSALFFIDTFMEFQPEGQNMFMREPAVIPVNTGLEGLLAHYGITVNRDIVLDRSSYQTSMRGFGEQNLYFAPVIEEAGLNRESVVTRFLKRVIFLKTSSLGLGGDKSRGMKTPLVTSSEGSWLMKGRISYMPWTMSIPPESQMSKYTLAAAHTGELTSYFAGRDFPSTAAHAGKTPITSHTLIKKSLKPVRIIVVGTSEITTPNIIDKEGKTPNAVLVHNMVDYLTGHYDVPEMRSKGLELNPIRETGDLTRLLLKLFNIAGLPALAVIAGLVAWRMRSMRKRKIKSAFSREAKHE